MVELYTPVFRVEVDGLDHTREVWRYLSSLEYTDAEEDESDTINITVANCPAFSIPKRGAALKLWLGWKESSMKYFGVFTVDEVSGQFRPASMTISAKSADITGGSTSKEKTDLEWENISLGDLAAKIAAKHGCKAKVLLDAHYTYQAQTRESDIAFLRRLAKEAGASLTIKDKTFVIAPYGKAVRAKSSISYTDVISGSWALQEREKYQSVTALWWNKDDAMEESVSSGDGKPAYVIKKRYANAAEAQNAAANYKIKLSKGELELDLTVAGNPTLVSGAKVACSGFSPQDLNGSYLAKSVTHSISKSSGWTTVVKLDMLS
ncbi:phage late control D family protein [Cloacibacillus evryensis]|uniref:phage late control D family protein n=1 Tax=Cloacibacillus evryensis TaxID=508460 RepID=UPI00210C51F0|nr:contractile injection system protein, VgrG/Pvc8 family [Cloacibacillus evryensis]MCQ4765093.1 contractile injection system protein, VgrG/Pvc8 family [Cloacibacillus evryensis]